MVEFRVNGRDVSFPFHKFEGTLSQEEYEKQIYTALSKIGISQKFVRIENIENHGVRVIWEINSNSFSFTCVSQNDLTLNMGAVAQAIQEDVRQILRGIKDLNLVMKQYSSEDVVFEKPKSLHDFNDNLDDDFVFSKREKVQIHSTIQAKRIVQEIKLKYPKFNDYSLIPEEDRDTLREAYIYLGVNVKF